MSEPNRQERNKALVREIEEQVWNARNPAAVERYHSADFRWIDRGAPQLTDRDSMTAFVTVLDEAFSDIRFTIIELIAEGDKVAKHYTFAAAHNGDFAGIPATGRRIENIGMMIYTIRDGMAVEAVAVSDTLGMMQQLGVIPAPEPAAAAS